MMRVSLTTEQWQARNRRVAAIVFKGVLALFCLPSIVYVPFAAPRKFLLIGTCAISTSLFILLLIGPVLASFRDGVQQTMKAMRGSWFVLWAPFLTGIITYALLVALLDLQAWATTLSWTFWRAAITATIVLFLGTICFLLRLYVRVLYGLTEIVIGIAVALGRLDAPNLGHITLDPNLALALLTASIFLVVRGLDNIHHGLTKEPRDVVPQIFWRWLVKSQNK